MKVKNQIEKMPASSFECHIKRDFTFLYIPKRRHMVKFSGGIASLQKPATNQFFCSHLFYFIPFNCYQKRKLS